MDQLCGMVLVGVICSPHGIKGLVKVKTFTDNPIDISSYGTLIDGTRSFDLSVVSVLNNTTVIAKIAGISTRSEAETLRNIKLYISSSQLPKPLENEFYVHDIIGMDVVFTNGEPYGTVCEVFNFGSCDVIEILLPNAKKVLLPFTIDVFPRLDTVARKLTVVPPEVVGCGK
ncbi:ribosome maturation factor RimM [Anaplasma bovis]|uniref:ribosome maturation factor RimM n=1 Tax=Anaplasma bovis TaxID=186733 RepID=UPI002FF3303D